MKKHLALVLALVMVLSSFSFVSAAPDFSDIEGATFENAVKRLELLEILEGYPDGTFKPENTITRAEFAAVAVRAQGLAGVAEAAAGLPSGFSDVPAWHWASGYVGTAASVGIVNGIGNGLFAPEAPVKYEEAVTMLVRALGYEPEAQSKGGYPFGYLVVAEDIGLLDDARGVQGTWATRGLVAQLTDNALEIPMMVSIGFGNDIRWVVSGSRAHDDEAVYLLNKLGVDEFEGIVMENFRVSSRLDEEEITMYDLNDEKNITLEVAENIDVDAVLGLEVKAWAMDDVVFSVVVETDADMIAYDTVSEADEDDATLVVLDDVYEWAVNDADYDDATVYVNNEEVAVEDAEGFGRIVMNSDDEIVFAYLFDVDANDYGVVVEIDEDEMVFVSVGSEGEEDLDLEEAEEIYVFNKEFASMSIEDIEAGMSVFFWIDSDDNYFMVAFDAMVEGDLEEVRTRDSRVTVDGTNYSKAAPALFSDDEMDSFTVWTSYTLIEDYVDEAVVVYLDYNGKVMVMITDVSVSTTVYGLVTWFSEGRTDTLSVFTAEGEEVTYDAKDRNVFDADDFPVGFDKGDDAIAVEIELNKDGEMETVVFEDDENALTKEADKERVTIDGTFYLTSDTVMIKAYDGSEELKPSLLDYEEMVDLAIDEESVIYMTDGDSPDLALVIFTGEDFQATDDTMYAIATGDRFVRSDDYRIELDVYGEGKAVYTIVGDDIDVKKGDLVTFKMNNNDEAVLTIVTEIADYEESAVPVSDVLSRFIVALDLDWRVTSDTLFYKVDSKGKLDGTTSFSRIDKDDQILVLADDELDLKVVVDLTPALGQVEEEAETFDVRFISNVEGFTVEVNGEEYVMAGLGNGTIIELEAGTYEYTATKAGYETITDEIVVEDDLDENLDFVALPTVSYTSGDDVLVVTVPNDEYSDYRVIINDTVYTINAGEVDITGLDSETIYEADLVAVSAPSTVLATETFIYSPE